LVNVQPCGREGVVRWSALHQAALSGSLDAVRFLLEHGAATDAVNSDGKTPMGVAKNKCVQSVLNEYASLGSAMLPTPLRATFGVTKPSLSKAVKVMKVTKAMKKQKNTKIAKGKRGKCLVYKGKFEKTVGGLRKEDITKNKAGKVVSKRMQAQGKKAYGNIKGWVEAFMKARAELGVTGFVLVKKGSSLYTKTKELCQ